MNVNSWLNSTPINRLDAELILSHTLGVERTDLHTHPERSLSSGELMRANAFAMRRQSDEPLAYITGYKEFYGRLFTVTSDTLIPRPETEALINVAKHLKPAKILDVGTGSGCIAITLALELPETEVDAVDISESALKIARQNAQNLDAKVHFFVSDLCKNAARYDLIVANLPYVDRNWSWLSPELKYEPKSALYAEDGGLALIKKLIKEAPEHLKDGGHLLLEADLSQHQKIADFATETGNFTPVAISDQSLALLLALRSR